MVINIYEYRKYVVLALNLVISFAIFCISLGVNLLIY